MTRTSRIALFAAFLHCFLVACATEPALEETCPEGSVRCGQACVDPGRDPLHCGGCGEACGAGEVCSSGACATSCEEGATACEGACVDTATDEANCGGCGGTCGENEICHAGGCACGVGYTDCGGVCVETDEDEVNCGACGNACAGGEICIGGGCELDCAEGLTACGDACVNTATDDAHCGGCGAACTGGTLCADGGCACPEGLLDCEGTCVDPASDDANCGACGVVCAPGEHATTSTCNEGLCASTCEEGFGDCDGEAANGCEAVLAIDAGNCGGCGTFCGEGAFCEAGICCGEANLVCGGACVDPLTDAAHCGGCGLGCDGWPESSGGACVDGACDLSCNAGRDDCNGLRDDGCEVDLSSDPANCGGCGNTCGAICGEGACLSATAPSKVFHHNCLRYSDGSVWCWGFNQYAQLGDGTTGNSSTPVRADIPAASSIAVGEYHNCARTDDGPVVCWGRNDRGQLGAGDTAASLTARTALVDGTVSQLALTESSSCALLGTGRVVCWGSGLNGRLGTGATDDVLAPSPVLAGTEPLEGAVELAAGLGHVCARLADGSVSCWGRNNNGQLGLGDSGAGTDRLVATTVPGLSGVDQIVAAGFRTCALIDGAARCWGQNFAGQVGDGSTTTRTSPADVQGLATAAALHIAPNHGCALLADGTARCWGLNNLGQLGDGTVESRATPVAVLDPQRTGTWTGLEAIVAGGAHTCAIRSDDQVFCWGYNLYGQLGDGTNANAPAPAAVRW